MRLTPLVLGTAFVAAFALTDLRDAVACGGCFHQTQASVPSRETTSSVITDHRMVFKVATNETILWDQVRYTGSPEEFAWVLPVREGAKVELSRDEFIGALDASTRTTVRAPVRNCRIPGGGTQSFGGGSGGGGCGSSEDSAFGSPQSGNGDFGAADAGAGATPEETEDVSVLSQSVIGPYQSVTLRAKAGEGISEWLNKNDFAIPETVVPTIDAYTREGFDFIALRLRPGQGVQAMRPVRVVTPGSDPTLPLRMVAAGVGARVGLTLWVISEGRYQAQSFPNAVIDESAIQWNFRAARSNLTDLQRNALADNGGRTWLTETSSMQSLSESFFGGAGTTSPGASYRQQCATLPPRQRPCDEDELPGSNGEPPPADAGTSDGGADADAGGSLADAGRPSQCTKMVSGCDGWDDMEVARRGLHEADIWVTRMRADLPVAALSTDLRLEAAEQKPVPARHDTTAYTDPNDDPCPDGVLRGSTNATPSTIPPEDDSSCTCRATRPLKKQTGTYVLIAATALAAARITRRQRKR